MKLNKQIAELICNLEYKVGWECFNPNSHDGYSNPLRVITIPFACDLTPDEASDCTLIYE